MLAVQLGLHPQPGGAWGLVSPRHTVGHMTNTQWQWAIVKRNKKSSRSAKICCIFSHLAGQSNSFYTYLAIWHWGFNRQDISQKRTSIKPDNTRKANMEDDWRHPLVIACCANCFAAEGKINEIEHPNQAHLECKCVSVYVRPNWFSNSVCACW